MTDFTKQIQTPNNLCIFIDKCNIHCSFLGLPTVWNATKSMFSIMMIIIYSKCQETADWTTVRISAYAGSGVEFGECFGQLVRTHNT